MKDTLEPKSKLKPKPKPKPKPGMLGKHHSSKTKARLRAESKKNWDDPVYRAEMVAKKRSKEAKDHISKVSKANWGKSEYRDKTQAAMEKAWTGNKKRKKKMSKALKGKPGHFTGRHHSAETIAKMRLASKGVPKSPAHVQAMKDSWKRLSKGYSVREHHLERGIVNWWRRKGL